MKTRSTKQWISIFLVKLPAYLYRKARQSRTLLFAAEMTAMLASLALIYFLYLIIH